MMTQEEFYRLVLEGQQIDHIDEDSEQDSFEEDSFEEDSEEVQDGHSTNQSQEPLIHSLLKGSGFTEFQRKQLSSSIFSQSPINDRLLDSFPKGFFVWEQEKTQFDYTLLLFEFTCSATELLNLGVFRNSQLLDALQRISRDVIKGYWHGSADKKERIKQTLVAISIKDDVNQQSETPTMLYFSHFNQESFEYFFLTDEVRQWMTTDPSRARLYVESVYQRHFKYLPTTSWKRSFISQTEREGVQKLRQACFGNSADNQPIYDAAEILIKEIGKDFGLSEEWTAVELDRGHFIGANAADRGKKNFTNTLQGFGVETKDVVLGYCVVQRKDKGALKSLKEKMSASNHLSNVLVIYIDKDEMVIQLWNGRQHYDSKLGKRANETESEVNQVVTTIRRFFQVSRNIECSPVHLAEDLASKALLFKSIAERELKRELVEYKQQLKTDGLNESNLLNDIKNGKLDDFWKTFPLLKLYFMFHTRLMTMEKSSSDKDRKEGFLNFSDVYAQTISYGLLASRWMSKDNGVSFKRENIIELLPSTSDFLKQIFVQLIEVDSSQQVDFCIKELFSTLYQVNVKSVFEKEERDPVIHFYEGFLHAYGKDIKKKRGVYYTPDEVVDFIVRSIDEQLKEEFGLPLGLASTKTWDEVLEYLNQGKDEDSKVKLPNLAKGTDVFVRILDPATGTGTFIKRALEQIRNNLKEHWKSLGWSLEQIQAEWKAYVSGTQGVEKDYTGQGLLSRLNAFELMMAPYIITHLRMGLLLQEDDELPFEFGDTDRLNVFLTNSLEHPDDRDRQIALFNQTDTLSEESHNADVVKRDTAITVVLGNPPYSGISSNNTEWITNQIEQYKYVDGVHFNERKHWLNDDYVRFIRYGELFIEKSTIGILGYINPHGFLDNPTFRGMRWQLLSTFSSIYVLDLHGNLRKKETAPDGSKDDNVFDIMQGVSINIFSLTTKNDNLGAVYHADVFGLRNGKVKFLKQNRLSGISWVTIPTDVYSQDFDFYFMVPKDFGNLKRYFQGFSIDELFNEFTSGVVTMGDSFIISFDSQGLSSNINVLMQPTMTALQIKTMFNLGKNYPSFVMGNRQNLNFTPEKIVDIAYRPFDQRKTYFDSMVVWRLREETMQHFINGENIGLVFKRGDVEKEAAPTFLTNTIVDFRSWSRPGMQGGDSIAPLYLYENNNKTSNLKPEIVELLQKIVSVNEEAILYYVYGVTHCRRYFETYADFLSFEYPRIPYPKDAETFQQLAKKGKELRHIHLLESEVFNSLSSKLRNKDGSDATTSQEITQYRPNGKTKKEAEKIDGWNGQIWINQSQYFEGVSELAWNFYIGGYQPAQKWLKDRKGRTLTTDEVLHYSKILKVLEETDRIMTEIDQIDFL